MDGDMLIAKIGTIEVNSKLGIYNSVHPESKLLLLRCQNLTYHPWFSTQFLFIRYKGSRINISLEEEPF